MEVLIVGAGVSSLLLAQSLLRHRACESIRIVGPRLPLAPHRLSYWSAAPTPFDAFADACWTSISVFADGRGLRLPLSELRYRTFRGQAWADAVRTELSASGNVEFVEQTVTGVERRLVRPSVRCGRTHLFADWVFTSVPDAERPVAWQRFLGWEILLEDRELDLESPTLLDFRTPAAGDLRFIYALPLASRRLFVEHVSYQPADHEAGLRAYLEDVVGTKQWSISDREGGATPLFPAPALRGDDRIVPIGVRAGMAKSSTGYALIRMWRDAERIAQSLALSGGRGLAPGPRAGSLYRIADRFFLSLLREDPAAIERLLAALFAGASGDAVLSFLGEHASVRQRWQVAKAMPQWLRWATTTGRVSAQA